VLRPDEISLVFYNARPEAETYLGGRYQKMTSILASMATVAFNRAMLQTLGEQERWALFDARAWQVPSQEEAANTLLWRELDAAKNSVSMVAQHMFPHSQLQGKSSKEMQEMLFQEHGINWNDYPPRCKRGAWFRRVEVIRAFTTDEIEDLPPLHAARKNPDLQVIRHAVQALDMPPFSRVQNRVGVIFEGSTPLAAES